MLDGDGTDQGAVPLRALVDRVWEEGSLLPVFGAIDRPGRDVCADVQHFSDRASRAPFATV